jgi:glycosyltransferase involved in cell wall biosynthesis
MKILILAIEITPYFVNSYKLASESGNELYVLHYTSLDSPIEAEKELDSIGIEHKNCNELSPVEMIMLSRNFDADVLICAGWTVYTFLMLCWLTKAKRVLITDSKWQATFKQRVAVKIRSIVIRPFFDYAFVPGTPQEIFMLKLGFSHEKIFKGLFAIATFPNEILPISQSERALLYIGRLSPEKGIERMLEGYKLYREISSNPLELWIAGTGALYKEDPNLQGVNFLGYIPNFELPSLIQKAMALVLFSQHEPWGVVIAESVANHRPVICSNSCGAAVDLVEDGVNGFVLSDPTPMDISDALQKFESISSLDLQVMSSASQKFAEIYGLDSWVKCLENVKN